MYVVNMLPTMEASLRWFVQCLISLVINEAAITTLTSDMDYGKMVVFSQAIETQKLKARKERDGNKKPRLTGNLGGSSSGGSGGRIRNCPSSYQSDGRGMAQLDSSAATTSITPPLARGTPAPSGRGAARGGAQSLGGPNRFYAIRGRQSSEASPDVVTAILTVQSHDVYALIDPDSTLSYVTPYVAMEFGIKSE
ncbi:uncharacterized protein [Nicotiana tomentosiformis]|uniref:uncharacterized protein n=1 Tax=Nicotiana tomentosiformis TaxID=4098 RepID=UPI00388C5C45